MCQRLYMFLTAAEEGRQQQHPWPYVVTTVAMTSLLKGRENSKYFTFDQWAIILIKTRLQLPLMSIGRGILELKNHKFSFVRPQLPKVANLIFAYYHTTQVSRSPVHSRTRDYDYVIDSTNEDMREVMESVCECNKRI